MEQVIEDYTKYVYISFGIIAFISILSIILFIVFFIKRNKQRKSKESELVNKIQSINSIKCPSCGKDIDGNSIYCKYCGIALHLWNKTWLIMFFLFNNSKMW